MITKLYTAIEALAAAREARAGGEQALLAKIAWWRASVAGAYLDIDARGFTLLDQVDYLGWVELRQLIAQLQRLGWNDQVRTLEAKREAERDAEAEAVKVR